MSIMDAAAFYFIGINHVTPYRTAYEKSTHHKGAAEVEDKYKNTCTFYNEAWYDNNKAASNTNNHINNNYENNQESSIGLDASHYRCYYQEDEIYPSENIG